jgi:hypothetical protein
MKITKQSLRRMIKEEVSALREERQFKLDPEMQKSQALLDDAIEAVEALAAFVQWTESLHLRDTLVDSALEAREALVRAANVVEGLKDPPGPTWAQSMARRRAAAVDDTDLPAPE